MKYTPNFNDPRIIKRINTSLDYALACLSPTKPSEWSTRQIDRWFGSQHNLLSKMIRSQLLIVSDPYYNPETKTAKKYLLNLQGAQALGFKVNRKFIPCALHLSQQKLHSADNLYGKIISQGAFEYTTKSNRMWNDIQRLDNSIRKPLFANYGYVNEYDIKSSAPTILFQYAKRCGLTRPTPTIEQYLKDPEAARSRLQQLLECDRKTAKQLITSRFAGARFGNNNSILDQLGSNWLAHNRLKQDVWFQDLSEDIKKLWDCVKQSEQLPRMNARSKWGVYFREELRVMRSVHKYLDKNSVRYFHEHDGWRSCEAIDVRSLRLHIEKQTDYLIDFDWEIFETTNH